MSGLWLLTVFVAQAAVAQDNAVTQVVTLLQEMLDKSKSDGAADREVFAKFKCYCDKNTVEKNDAIETATIDLERMDATLADRRAQNEKLSQEVAHLKTSMEENDAARAEATNLRDKEHQDFLDEEQDLETGSSQLDRAIDILAAVGADQTQSASADTEQFMAAEATATAKAGFLVKKANLKELGSDMKKALRAASVFLSNKQRQVLTGFLQAPFTGNYNSQSGEIVGVLKSMSDTFKANLKNARDAEAKAEEEYNALIAVKIDEYEKMDKSFGAKKVTIGDNADEIATTSSEHETVSGQKADDEDFLGALTDRCTTKSKEFEHRNMLRANEEAAIAEAISILNSDAAFSTFGKSAATSTGATSFVQLSHSKQEKALRGRVIAALLKQSKSMHSLRLARVVSALTAENPFSKVLSMIEDMITLIEEEGASDKKKFDWCDSEQSTNEDSKSDREDEIDNLKVNINTLQVSAAGSRTNIENGSSDLDENRAAQAQETETRTAQNAQFNTNLKNLQDAEKILAKATEVLTKFYDWLHKHNAAHHYDEKANKDSGGGNLERLEGKSVEELEEACSAKPECVGFNSAGWLKSSLAAEEEWYAWDGGSLYVKVFEQTREEAGLIQEEPATWGDEMEGQRSTGNQVIDMLTFIAGETKKEKDNAIDNERTAQSQYETNMQSLTNAEKGLLESIAQYKLDLATSEKQIEEAHENLARTEKEHAAIVRYLAEIEPGCSFMQANIDARKTNQKNEAEALKTAADTLKASPAFQAAVAAQEREDLGKCAGTCEEDGMDHAKCQACLNDVTVFGYCSQNGSAPGCSDATATGSAGALA